MKSRTTVKDIATEAGVSLATVHAALNNKPGVGEPLRERICEIAKELDYHSNNTAASLRRKACCIMAIFPEESGENGYYYSKIWNGFRAYMKTLEDYHVETIEVPYNDNYDSEEMDSRLSAIIEDKQIDGIISVGYSTSGKMPPLEIFSDMDIPIVLVGNDNDSIHRICCVQTEYQILGQILAEILTKNLQDKDKIFLCVGNPFLPSHSLMVDGFFEYLKENEIKNTVIRIEGIDNSIVGPIQECLEDPDIKACSSVTARGSVLLGRTIESQERQGSVMAVGSDLFHENADFLKRGTFSMLLHKKVYMQSFEATQILTNYLMRNEYPEQDKIFIKSEVVFKSSLPMYHYEKKEDVIYIPD